MSASPDLCAGCFEETRRAGACPACGFDEGVEEFHSVLAPRTVLGDRYIVGRVLGKPGGFGVTYLAFDQRLQRRLALKELMPRNLVARRQDGATLHPHTKDDEELFGNTRQAFLNEARTLAKFSHPNLVRVLDYFEGNGTAYFAMEYYEGEAVSSFSDEIHETRGRPLTQGEALALMVPILQGLQRVHAAGILHRDIKPSNIYLTRGEQRPVLLDFGSARQALGESTRTLTSVLTPGYAPFEQYHGRGDQGPWTDVYGCAATLYFLVTRRQPPEAGSRIDGARLIPPAEIIPGMDPAFSATIVQGLAMGPRERPQTTTAFADFLRGRGDPTTLVGPDRADEGQSGMGLPASGGTADATRVAPPGDDDDRTRVAPGSWDDRTRLAPRDSADGATVVAPPLDAPPTGKRQVPSWLMPAGVGAMLVVAVGTGFALWRGGGDEERPGPVPLTGSSVEESAPAQPLARPAGSTGSAAGGGAGAAEGPEETGRGADGGGPDRTGRPGDDPGTSRPSGPAAAAATDPAPTDPPREVEEALPLTSAVVVVFGESPAATRAETTLLRSLLRAGNLAPMDAGRLQILRGDDGAVQSALAGDFGSLARLGRRHGAAVLLVGDLSVEVVEAGSRMPGFHTGRAELDLRLYDTRTGRIVGADLFRVGGGGQPGKLGASPGDARQQAVEAVAEKGAAAVEAWVAEMG